MPYSAIYDVKTYGALGDGSVNDAPAIQAAINDASGTGAGIGGGVVWFPPGVYRLGFGLNISNQVVLAGSGWNPSTGNGSWLYVDSIQFKPIIVSPMGRGCIIRDLALKHAQPDPGPGWTPWPYPFALTVQADDVYLQNLLLLNPTRGIAVYNPGGTVGRVSLDRIWGQPLLRGISISDAWDVIKVHNVHFWPFWNWGAEVQAYQSGNAVAVKSYRNDNPHFSNFFALGYKYGFHFAGGADRITSKFRIANADLDFCNVGLQVSGDGTTGQFVNFTAQGANGSPAGVRVEADGVKLQGSNIRVTNYAGNGIRAQGNGTILFLENVWVENWNQSGQGFPGIEGVGPATVFVGRSRFFENGGGAPATGGSIILDN